MKKPIFTGVATALITPFKDGKVDYEAFERLLNWQIKEGVNALVVCGTTGESSTLSDEEHRNLIKFAVEKVNGRVPVIAGTGSNDTEYAVSLTKQACEDGADACLLVTPYYNKTTQKGLIEMYYKIADNSTKPVILYNVPSRTGVNIEPNTYKELVKHENICAIKEANGMLSKIVDTMALVGDNATLYSGNDDQIVPLLSLGAKGVISVLSNVMPKKTVEICNKFFKGDIEGAAKLQFELLPLIHALFSEVNPIPVKAAMNLMGFCTEEIRLPLTTMEKTNYDKLINVMNTYKLLKE